MCLFVRKGLENELLQKAMAESAKEFEGQEFEAPTLKPTTSRAKAKRKKIIPHVRWTALSRQCIAVSGDTEYSKPCSFVFRPQ